MYYSNFTNNVARQSGGAILWYGIGSSGGDAKNNSVIGCFFLNNTAYIDTPVGINPGGGAMYYAPGGSDSVVRDTIFINNTVQSSAYKADGGAILWDECIHGEIDNCIFNGNFVNGTTNDINLGWVQGGALFIRCKDYTISNCKFMNNWCTKDGGAVYMSNKKGGLADSIRVYNTTFINNTIKHQPGDNKVYGGGAVQIKEFNTGSGALFDNVTFVNNSANYGGAIRIFDKVSTLSLNNCIFDGNNATVDGGSICLMGDSNNCKFNNLSISNSHAERGGGIYSNNIFMYTNMTFTNNSATQGGGLYWDRASVGINDMTFINNTATEGGAVYIVQNSANVSNNNFTNNSADYGGAIYVYSNLVDIGNNNFTKNSAVYGGAIYEWETGNTCEIHDASFDENYADYGGAIYAGFSGASSNIKECNFTNNVAIDGGAIYIAGSNQNVVNCTFDANNATRNGGAIYVKGSLSSVNIKNSTFINSHAGNGGAIYSSGYPSGTTSFQVTIENDTFIKNTAVYNGGAILYSEHGKYYRDYNKFDNIAVIGPDGRTSVSEGSTTFIERSLFEDNYDYLFEINAIPDPEVRSLQIILNAPDFNPKTGKKFRWVVNLTNASGFFRQVVVTEDNYISHYHEDEFHHYLFVTFDENLRSGETYNITSSFNTTYFDDESYITKENSTNGTVWGYDIGQFALLQRQIENNITSQILLTEYTIVLTRDSYRFTWDDVVQDNGTMNITNIDKPLKIIGNGCIIDARGFSRIFNITASNVTFINVTFTGGNASGIKGDGVDYGGAIFWAGANGVLEHCLVDNNTANVGGGIYFNASASNCKIIDSTFEDNFANTNGGAIDCNASRMNLTNTVFDNNHANIGAALCREINATDGLGFGNNFTNNIADQAGAALAWINATHITIDNYYFYNNTAGYSGGALYVGEGSVNCNVLNSIFVHNYVDNDKNGIVNEADKGTHGGAIEWYSQRGLVSNSTFINNSAYDGGAIYVGDGSDEITITNSNFTENMAVTTGGAIGIVASAVTINASNFYYNNATSGAALYVGGEGTTNYIYSSTFVGNKAYGGNGGAIDWVSSSGHIDGSIFTGNCANNGGGIYFGGNSSDSSVSHCNFTDNHAIFLGGAIDANASKMNLTNTLFDSNTAQYGAGLCRETNATGGFGYNNIFTNNHAHVSGAALGWMQSVNITITNYTFINNTADVSGGAIYVGSDSHNCSIIDSTFENNYVTNNTSVYPTGWDYDAWDGNPVYYVIAETYTEEDVNKTFINESSRTTTFYHWHEDYDGYKDLLGVGGAIDCSAANATIRNSNFTNNTAKFGGAINVGSASGNTKIFDSIFRNNTAYEDGGAINLFASDVDVQDSYFYDNVAIDGGALYVGGSGMDNHIHRSYFEGNNATAHGGAIFWIAYAGFIEDSNFTHNFADNGGAIYLNLNSGNTNITGSRFSYNNATHNGGAIDCNSTNMGLYNTTFEYNEAEYGAALAREIDARNGHGTNNTFIANHARVSGAALAWLHVENVKIYNYTFINNTAEHSGGAIYVAEGSINCLVFNSTFEGNHLTNMSSGHNGGAIDCTADNLTVNMSKFTNNGANIGGAIYIGSKSNNTQVHNSTFTANYATDDGGAIALKAAGVVMDDSFFYNNTADHDGGALYLGGDKSSNVIRTSYFEGNIAQHNGGAIDCNASGVAISDTYFIKNIADYGAALCREEHATGGGGGNNTFRGNYARISGAALAWLGADGIQIVKYTFENNSAGSSGGAIYVMEGSDNCRVINSTFDTNYVNDVIDGRGGAIDWIGKNGTIINSTFKKSFAVDGGSVYVDDNSVNFTVINSLFTSSKADGKGGAIAITSDNARILDSNFTQTSASSEGGAIAMWDAYNLTVNNCLFNYTLGAGDDYSEIGVMGYGGGIFLSNVTLINLSNLNFTENQARSDGSGIFAVRCNDASLYNLTFYGVISLQKGGCIAWVDSDNLTVDACDFGATAAVFGGGSIYLERVNDTIVKNSLFNNTSANWGAGGAIWLVEGNTDLINCSFYKSKAQNGGALYIAGNVTTYNLTAYDSSSELDGAFIYIDYDNLVISNFTSDKSISLGNGGVVYINATNITVSDFTVNDASANEKGGVVYVNGNNATIANFNATHSNAKLDAAVVYVNADNVTIANLIAIDSNANDDGGVIHINANNVTIDNFTSITSLANDKGGVIYVNGSVTMNNMNLSDYSAKTGEAIYFANGTSKVSNSTFVGPNTIFVSKNVTVYLMRNNITGDYPNKDTTYYLKDNSTDAVSKTDYSVWCDGELHLDKNTFDYVIFNNGTIKTPTSIYMLGNGTDNNTVNETYFFWAHIVDDFNNTIISVSSLNSSNQLYPDMSFAMSYNCIPLETYLQGVFYLRAFDDTLEGSYEYNGTLYVKMPTNLIIEVGEEKDEILPVTIRITTPIDSNFTINNQKVHIIFKNLLTGDEDTFDAPIVCVDGKWAIATANFTKDHLHTGSYSITATYDGDGTHWGSDDNTVAVVNSRPIYIIAQVQEGDIFYGQPIYINVTTNATNTENGRVYIRIDGKEFSIGLKLNDTGKGINETEEYFEWGYLVRDGVHDGLYIIPNKNFTEILAPGIHVLEIKFDNGTYWKTTTNTTTFEIKGLTTDIIVQYENITYGQSELINVTVNENATGYISIRIGTQVYSSPINEGIARFNITGLGIGTYSDINVTYTPLTNNGFVGNVTNFTFKVDPTRDYEIDIWVDSMQYGENATVRVLIPGATGGNVTIYVDGNEKGNVTLDDKGNAVLENITGLAGGSHRVNVTYLNILSW